MNDAKTKNSQLFVQEKFRCYLYRKKVYCFTDQHALELLMKRIYRSILQFCQTITRWLDHAALFHVAVRHIAGSDQCLPSFSAELS